MGYVTGRSFAGSRYSGTTSNTGPSACQLCDEGHYCIGSALVRPTGVCDAGFYCRFGVTLKQPTAGATPVTNATSGAVLYYVGGGVCPAGYICTVGTGAPVPCVAGTDRWQLAARPRWCR